jgi:hypothetical protein
MRWQVSNCQNTRNVKITSIQSDVAVRGKHAPFVHPATKVDAVTLSVRLVASGGRRHCFTAMISAMDDVFAAHVDGVKVSAGVETFDYVKHVFLAQAPIVKLYKLVDGPGVNNASRSDGANILDMILRVCSGEIAQRLKLGVPTMSVKAA